MSIYDEMRPVAADLLQEFDQGGLALKVYRPGDDADDTPWSPGAPSWETVPFAGVVSGVTADNLADSLVQATDLKVVMPGKMQPKMADRVVIGGADHQIIMIKRVPAAGVPIAWVALVRK